MNWILIRHGQTVANEKKQYCGKTDEVLSDFGKEQLKKNQIHCRYQKGDYYVVSTRKRTLETLQELYGEVEYHIMPEFDEINFGIFEGKTYEELKENPEYLQWIKDTRSQAPEGGESGEQFQIRIRAGLMKLSELEGKETLVVITHGGVIATIMEELFEGEKNFYEWQPECGKGYVLSCSEKMEWRYGGIECLN